MKLKTKAFVFIQFFSLGVIGPYLAVYLYQKDYSGAQIGLLLGTMPIVMVVSQPLWSYLSDIWNSRRNLLMVGSLGVAIAAVGLGQAGNFGLTFFFALLFAGMRAPIAPISTAIILDYLEDIDSPDDFSRIRLWGSVSFGLSSLLLGSLFLDQILVYFTWFIFGLYIILAGLSLLLPERQRVFTYSGINGIQIITENPKFVIYLLASIFVGGTMGVYNNFQAIFLQSLGAAPWLVGLTVSLQAFLEVPMMLAIPFMLNRFSMRWILLAGGIVLPIRWLLYVFIQQPGWVIPTQLMHGVGVVSFMVVGVLFTDILIPAKWRATGQGVYGTAMNGIGTGLGVYLAGYFFEWFGIRSVWQINVLLGLIGLGLLIWAVRRTGNPQK